MKLIPIRAGCGCIGFHLEGTSEMVVIHPCDLGQSEPSWLMEAGFRPMDESQHRAKKELSIEETRKLFKEIQERIGQGK
jgi:hypothetical protein